MTTPGYRVEGGTHDGLGGSQKIPSTYRTNNMSKTLIAKNVELSFSKKLFEPQNGKRSCNLIETPESGFVVLGEGAIKKGDLTGLVESVLKAKFDGVVPPKAKNWVIRSNKDAVSMTTSERYSGYEDDKGIYFSPSRFEDQGPPAFVRRDGSVINTETADGLAEAKRLFRPGAIVNGKINVVAFDAVDKETKAKSRGATTFLEALQFMSEGTQRGAAAPSAEGFDVIEDSEDF